MTTLLEQENTTRALKGEPIAKICVQCVHYDRRDGQEICMRDHRAGFHNVSGKIEEQGEIYCCNIEREIDHAFPAAVKNKTRCGAIGQFWEQNPKPRKPWYIFWRI